ncbi:MAG: hypothetical protein JRN34_00205 [Nitrososphaerota archaeon]|nr:hypothetical protein [Nitrososphaerota archaeon]MDG6943173.1 hypothetical protein [Nitrososphaerota archaeon]MDG6950949.1 hypothetical protein [Nitrososphaerota archaeon]
MHVVYAKWCPHCVPTTVEPLKKRADELGIPCFLHDIDSGEVKVADELVEKYGNWTPDYLIPQVFLERVGGRIELVMTGNPHGVALTRAAVDELLTKGPLAESRP